MLFVAGAVSFFWVTGIIQSFLPLYNNNNTFPEKKINPDKKSVEIFNAFLLLTFFSLVFTLSGLLFKHNLRIFAGGQEIPHFDLFLLYLFFSSPSNLVEYIYLIKNKAWNIFIYGIISFSIQLAVLLVPILLGMNIRVAIWGLVVVAMLRFLLLIVLIIKYAEFKFSWPFLIEHLKIGFPLIISTLLSGSAQYIDGMIVGLKYNSEAFAVFRYGAKELPLVVMIATGFNNAMLQEFSNKIKIRESLQIIKKKSLRLMHILFPISIVLLVTSGWLFPRIFNDQFGRSSDIFVVYLLMVTNRLVFPQTILIGMKQTKIMLRASVIGIILNISLSLLLIKPYGLVGVALATIIVYTVEKAILVSYNYFRFHIHPRRYIPLGWFLFYSVLILIVFVLVDHRIIFIK